MTPRAIPYQRTARQATSDGRTAPVEPPPAVVVGWQDASGDWRGATLSLSISRGGLLVIDLLVLGAPGQPALAGRLGLDGPRAQILARALLTPQPTGEEIWGETPEGDLFPLRLPEADP